jgi:tetratricopeptide (TPR) repeat protein
LDWQSDYVPEPWSPLNDDLANVRERGIERLDWVKSGYKFRVLTPELDRLADEYAGSAASTQTRSMKVEALLRAAVRRVPERRHRLRVEIVFGLNHAGASATELRRLERHTFGEERLDVSKLRSRERQSFAALEQAIYELLADPGSAGRSGLADLDEYLAKVRGRLASTTRAQVFVLPTPDLIFVNRVTELEGLDAATSGGGGSVSFLVGMPGAGKSAAAIHFAARYRYRFVDAVIHVDLARANAAEVALGEIGFQLGVADALASLSIESEREAFMRAILAGRRILIILDDASLSSLVGDCLRALLGADVVVTTRFHTLAETRPPLIVEPLARSASLDLLTEVIGAARLEREPESAARIVDLLGDLPLAIRVYGARITRSRSKLSTHVARLETFPVTSELSLTDVVQQSKNASVPASFALSFDALDADQLAMIQGLGALSGAEFTTACAAEIAGISIAESDRIAGELYGRSLLLNGLDGRWKLHPLIDDFVRSMYPASTPHRQRLMRYAARLSERVRANARTSREPQWFGRLELDRPAIDRATSEARRFGDIDAEAMIISGVARVAAARGTGIQMYPRLKELSVAPVSQVAEEALLEAATWLAGELSEFVEGLELGERWLRTAVRLREPGKEATALGRLASHAWCAGRYSQALRYLRRAQTRWRQLGDEAGLTTGINLRGLIHCYEGRFVDARRDFRTAVEQWTAQGDVVRRAMAQHNLAEAERCLGRLEPARTLYESSLDVRVRERSTWDVVNSFNCLGELSRASDDHGAADRYFLSALELAFPMWNKVAVATAVAGRASLHIDDDPQHAGRLLGAAEALLRQAGSRLGPANLMDYGSYRIRCSQRNGATNFRRLLREGAALTPVALYEQAKLMPTLA